MLSTGLVHFDKALWFPFRDIHKAMSVGIRWAGLLCIYLYLVSILLGWNLDRRVSGTLLL